ncbi:FtsQ-type POTRA domain-containing protein [Wolbachia endosymbiont of Dipetalonema caudispina]|nr:FtsQ-type POTRA domain-containing protein [Wolbachia endosymbiont of Dipetalonema caudispina]
MLYVSISKLADSIQSISKWIKFVRIYRTLPNTLSIIWMNINLLLSEKKDNKALVINFEGKVIAEIINR